MNGSASIKVDTRAFNGYMARVTADAKRVTRRVLRDMARDAALLARARAPHNMNPSTIKWDLVALGPIIRADGATAAYDGGEVNRTFNHPIFASPNIPRKQWNWTGTANTPSQPTYPFIEEAAREVVQDAELLMGAALQEMFDSEEAA